MTADYEQEERDKRERVRLAVAVVVEWDRNPKGRTLAELIVDALKEYGRRGPEQPAPAVERWRALSDVMATSFPAVRSASKAPEDPGVR